MPETTSPVRPAGPSIHMLGAAEPLPMQAARWLARDWSGNGPLDLRSTLILVPTQGAGRRLRQALAYLTSGPHPDGSDGEGNGAGVLIGPVWTPGTALKQMARTGTAEPPPATAIWLAYASALLEVNEEEVARLFPSPNLQRTANWALQTAAMMVEVRELLAESGSDADTVIESKAAAEMGDGDRWLALRSIERLAREHLQGNGWSDPLLQQRQAVEAGFWPDEVERMVVVAVPDPVELARRWWQVVCGAHAVELLVYAPDGLPQAGVFDTWGRPDPEAWQRAALTWEQWPCQVELWSRPAAVGRWCADVVRNYGDDWSSALALVVPDANMAGDVASGMNERGVKADDLQAQGWGCHPWRHLLAKLTRYLESGSAQELVEIARCNPVVSWLQSRVAHLAPGFWLTTLTKVELDHLPTDGKAWLQALDRHHQDVVERAQRQRGEMAQNGESDDNKEQWIERSVQNAAAATEAGRQLVQAIRQLKSPEDVAAWLSDMACVDAAGLDVAEQAHAAADLLRQWSVGPLGEGISQRPANVLQAMVGHFERCGVFGLQPDSQRIQLNGWLEALWEDAPHLVIAGLHEGAVPETVTSHPFLPESLRQKLNLKTNQRRYARDAYLLACVLCGRGPGGHTDLALVRQTSDGDPLKPSRLLFQGDDKDLPSRVDKLFGEAVDHPAVAPPAMPWQLSPALKNGLERVSVTAFTDYLRCPFRYYLKHVLKMRADDLEKHELDAMQFGTVVHEAWEWFCQDQAHLNLVDEGKIERLLLEGLDHVSARRFGNRLPVAVQVQLDSARNRLRAAAPHQAAARREGWRIIAVEAPLQFDIGGLEVRGKIDRIEVRETPELGIEYRVIDYKTSDKAKTPEEAHVKKLQSRSNPDRYSPLSLGQVNETAVAWENLQLPLYVEQLRRQHGEEVTVRCGYFNLPKVAAECGINEWSDYDPVWHESAMTCAADVVAAIRRGDFWPPSENVPQGYDEFSELILHSMLESVDPQWHRELLRQWNA